MKNLSHAFGQFRQKLAAHEHTHFDTFILCVIVISAILNGFETNHELMQEWRWQFHLIDNCILSIFVFEVLLKISVQGAKPWRYFTNAWNLFDFAIVVMGFAPLIIHLLHPEFSADYHAVAALRVFRLARAVRVLRVFRLITHLRELQILVETLVSSVKKLLYVGLLLFCLFYVYAVIGVFLFRENDPTHFRDLHQAHMTLFQCITGDGWSDVMTAQINTPAQPNEHFESYPFISPMYFASFIIMGSYVLLNLVVGIIISAMEAANEEHERERDAEIMASEQMQWQMLKAISERLERMELAMQSSAQVTPAQGEASVNKGTS